MNRSDPGIPFTITPSDSVDFINTTRGIALGAVGTVVAVTRGTAASGRATVTIAPNVLAAGVIHPIVLMRINLTGTSATPIVGFY